MQLASTSVICAGEFTLRIIGIPSSDRGMSVGIPTAANFAAMLYAVSGRMIQTRLPPDVVIAASKLPRSRATAAAVTPVDVTAVAPFVIAAGRNPADSVTVF